MVYKIGWRNRVGGYNTPRGGDVKPTDLFHYSASGIVTRGLTAGLDAADLSLTDGSSVASWDDPDSDLLMEQGTASTQPTYRSSPTGFNGEPAVEGDGLDDSLDDSDYGRFGGSKGEWWVVARVPSGGEDFHPVLGSRNIINGSSLMLLFNRDHANGKGPGIQVYAPQVPGVDNTIIHADSVVPEDETHIITIGTKNDGSEFGVWVDGVEQNLTLESGNNDGSWSADISDSQPTMFTDRDENHFVQAFVARSLYYSGVELTSSERDRNVSALKDRYGIS